MLGSPQNAPRKDADREQFLEAALDSYLASILDIAEMIASLGTDVAVASKDRLVRLHNRLSYDKSEKTLEESRSALHAELLELQSKLREERLLAYLDPLTGMPNRREFNRQLAARIADGRSFCVLLFDLNTFRCVNYDHGHLCGDEILRQLGKRLTTHVRPGDLLCRWGGDEFVAILECSLANAQARSEEIAELLSKPYQIAVENKEIEVTIGVSVGVVERMTHETAEQVIQRADEAMYRQKSVRP